MGAKYTDAQAKASKKYIESLDVITIKIPKEKGEKIRESAKAEGKSVTQYILSKLNME